MKHVPYRVPSAILAMLTALCLSACSGAGSRAVPANAPIAAGSLSQPQRSSLGLERSDGGDPGDFAGVEPRTPPNVAGTYDGTITEVQGSHSASGTVTLTINQKGKKISGPFDPTFGSHTYDLSLAGTVKRKHKGAKLTFTVINPDGRSAYFKATVVGSKLNGTGIVPASGSKPQVDISIKTTKQS